MATYPAHQPRASQPGTGVPSEHDGPLAFRAVMLLVAVIAAVFTAMVLFGAFLPRVYGEVAGSVDADLNLPDETELAPLRERSYVHAADGSLLAILHGEEDRVLVGLDGLPDHVWQAIVTAEDRRFFTHQGYDVEGIGRAFMTNLRARSVEQGGSTITQQLAKLNFLDNSVTLDRKFSELLYAMALEREFDKAYLLERYLNQVYFGAGAYGVQAAAEEYWGIDADELEPQHAATLAGVIRAPGLYDPRRDPGGALLRRNQVLAAMAEEGYLTPDEAQELAQTGLDVLDRSPRTVREPYVVEAVKREFLANPAFGETREERREALFGGGLELHTTIQPRLQEIAREVVGDHFPDDAPTAAIAAVEHDTGAVVALQSGQDFDTLQYDLALQGRRQPGSAMKVFVMLEALDQGLPATTRLTSDSPLRMQLPGEVWTVANYGGRSFGSIDMAEAIRSSVNTYYAQLARRVGVSNVAALTEELGIDPVAYGGYAGIAAVSIGGLERGITPLEMASAYGVMANGGVRAEPFFLERVTHEGDVVWEHEASEHRVLSREVAATATAMLEGVVERGTGRAARLDGWEVAGKTGTTNDNYDAWFVGMTPVLSTSVWVGYASGNVTMADATGGGIAAPAWRDFMERALEDHQPRPFPDKDLVEGLDERGTRPVGTPGGGVYEDTESD